MYKVGDYVYFLTNTTDLRVKCGSIEKDDKGFFITYGGHCEDIDWVICTENEVIFKRITIIDFYKRLNKLLEKWTKQ